METGGVPGAAGAGRAARGLARQAAPGIELLARLGFAAKGAVYILIGGLAAAAALTGAGGTTGSSGALASLAGAGWGRALLGVIAVGLAGYASWRAVSALLDPEHESGAARAFHAVTAFIYAGLAFEAARLALTGTGAGSDDEAAHWSAELMRQPFGQLALAAVGVGLGLYGLHQIWSAWRSDLDARLDLRDMSRAGRTWAIRFGRFGLAARGVVFGLIGALLVVAAVQADPSEAQGLGGTLASMRGTPWALGLVALGLVAYGLYQIVRARYRRIPRV